MEHVPPPAEELALLDQELVRLDARRLQLLNRRAWLMSVLRPPVAPPPFAAPPARLPAAPFGWGSPVGAAAAPASGASGASGVQNVLLVLGGLLLTIAAIAFTLFSWGEMGIAGRSAVLATVTVAALAAPALLLRRRLSATAEALAALALVLTVLDAYALHAVAVPDTDGLGFAAVSSAVLTALWTAYGLALGRLRLPLPAAVVAGQLPLVLAAWAAGAQAAVFGWALLVTAAADVAVVLWGRGLAVRITAGVGAASTGLIAMLIGLGQSVSADGPLAAAGPGALLLAGAVVALFGAWRAPKEWAVAAGTVAGLAAVAAVGGVLRPGLPWNWSVVVYLLCGAALTAVVRVRVPQPVGRGVLVASAAVTAGAVLWALPAVAAVLLGPVSLLTDVWAGAPGSVRGALGPSMPWPESAASPVVLVLVAGLLAALYAGWDRVRGTLLSPRPGWRVAAAAGAMVLGWGAALALPAVTDVPYAVAVGVELLLVAGLLAVTVRQGAGALGLTALVCALVGAVSAGLLALAAEPATYAVSVCLLVLFAGAAARSKAAAVQSVLAGASVLCAIVPVSAVGASLGWSAPHTAPLVLVVPAVTVLLGARLRVAATALTLELTGAFGAVVAVGLAVTDAPFLALVLALCGVLAAGTAVRPDRRPVAGYLAAALFVTAAWVRLVASEVSDPEAYTLPVSVIAFAVGYLRRRTDPAASSWVAYGPALSMTMVPSLVVAWVDPYWLRPLLLGVAALVVTLAGARFRLQAPLVLGGSVLALVGLHELAPHVVQVFDALPRWAPPALAGLLLLALGATYEQRLRDARRVRESLGRMR
ncbi:SCO7613 C-terminal domain-containing membrane protein [Streptomyces sp. NPDC060022]|uniref:SCO7613 C-terminal domain-containing membrane protein n=1 Tax=Streptomyces sp. NPDC060022 TaxID=3347039 RepID=UPI003673A9AE